MIKLPFPTEINYPTTTNPVLTALRQLAQDSVIFWRQDSHRDHFTVNINAAIASKPCLTSLIAIEWRDDMNLHLLLPNGGSNERIYHYTLASLLHNHSNEPLGMKHEELGIKLAFNLMLLTIDHSDEQHGQYHDQIIAAGLALGITKTEFARIRNPVFIEAKRHQYPLEIAARQKYMLLHGWSLNLSLIERRALATTSFIAGIQDNDQAINKTLRMIDTGTHDNFSTTKLQPRHILDGHHLDEHIEFYFCAIRCAGDIGGVGNIFSLMGDTIEVHRRAPEMLLSIASGKMLEEVINHPLFIGSGIRVISAYPDEINASFFLKHDAATTNREVPIDEDVADKIWNQNFGDE